MRRIGLVPDEEAASLFSDFLTANGCENTVEPSAAGVEIWVHNEDRLEAAKADLEEFLLDPEAARFRRRAKAAKVIQREAEREEKRRGKLYIDYRTDQAQREARLKGGTPVTFLLLALSIYVALVTHLGDIQGHPAAVDRFLIEPVFSVDPTSQVWPGVTRVREGKWEDSWRLLTHIRDGEWWRLLAPIFLHYGFLHILFNMSWLKYLGPEIERRSGSLKLLLLVLLTGALSNLAQYFVSGPGGGGFSGVVYALFGYVWMKSKFDPARGWMMEKNNVYIMVGWLFLCMTGLLGNIGNTAHVSGLILGMVIGAAPSLWGRLFK